MDRRVESELLDDLAADDPRAIRSRQDLQRLNAWMGNAHIMAGALRSGFAGTGRRRIVELGAGDGKFMLEVAQRLSRNWKATRVVLLDRHKVVSPQIQKDFDVLGWQMETLTEDAFDWLNRSSPELCDAIIANLFLHHFSTDQLSKLFNEAKKRTNLFVAVEPRRSGWSLAFSRMSWLIGCGEVTQHDAPISVRAGFAERELSQLWPADERWALREGPAGLFSHLFVARRIPLS